jgi:membrane dipeptidase
LTELPSHGVEVAKPQWGGLSPAGKVLIHEMNRMGMIVDLAHVSQDTMRDVLNGTSLAPVMFSHSSSYTICPHPRNVPDSILKLVKDTNSIVMINFAPDFISCTANTSDPAGLPEFYPKNSTLEQVIRHITHIGKLIGYDHVGVGSDFDGIESTPMGLEDVSKFPDLVKGLLAEGVSKKNVKKIIGDNILRVWSDVERVAKKLQKSGVQPVEDVLSS